MPAPPSPPSSSHLVRELGEWFPPAVAAWVAGALEADEYEELPAGLRAQVAQRLTRSRAVHGCLECRTLSLWIFVRGLSHCRACGEPLTRGAVSRAVVRPREGDPASRARLLDATPPVASWLTAPLRLPRPVAPGADTVFVAPRRAEVALASEVPEAEVERAAVERLRQAIDELEASPVDGQLRARLSKDPGAKQLREALGAPSTPRIAEGSRHVARGRFEEALEAFSEAIRENPHHPQPWTKRGIVRARTGDLAGAVQDYSEALGVDDVYLPAWANRASAEFHRGNLEATVHDASRALELAPSLAQAWLFRGIARARLGEARAAEEDLFQFLELSPYSPYVRLIRNTLREVDARLARSA
ncbi:MAG: tetratricopeptide repeat protein [Planctomycetes bacterium]|nr:tetratricopeptide repeat protein [Planctomycetota bacterium]